MLALVGALAAGPACGGAGADDASGPLRVAVPQWPGYEPLHLAEVEGLYTDAGVDVEIVDFVSLADAERAFNRGEVDGFAGTLGEVLMAREPGGRDPVAVLVTDYSDGADVLVGSPGIGETAELRGRSVGIARTARAAFLLNRALDEAGLRRDELEVLDADANDLPRLLRDGSVDAIQSIPPYSTGLLLDGYPRLFSSAEIPGEIVDVVAFGGDVLDARQGEVERFVATWQAALDLLEADSGAALRIMADREGLAPEELEAARRRVRTLDLAEQVEDDGAGDLARACRRVGDALVETGHLASAAVADGCVDLSIVERVLR